MGPGGLSGGPDMENGMSGDMMGPPLGRGSLDLPFPNSGPPGTISTSLGTAFLDLPFPDSRSLGTLSIPLAGGSRVS